MNSKIFSLLILSVFLLSTASAMAVYSDFASGSQSATINVGQSISFSVDFFSMNPPITSMKVQLFQGNSLISTFLDSSTNEKTFSHTYTYTANTAGNFEIRIIGTDGVNTDSEFLTLTANSVIPPVNHAPVITSSPVTQVNEGQYYSYHVTATDADGDTLTYSLISAPSWLSINSVTGLISGTAPLVSSDTDYNIIVSVSDGTHTVTQPYTLTVKNVPVPPTNHAPVANSNSVTTNENTPITINLHATDSDNNPLTYSIVNNPSHGFLSGFNSLTGQVTYTPNSGFYGTDSFIFVANDGTINSNTATISITVNSQTGNHAPVITSSPVTSVTEGNIYNYHVDATDADNDFLTYSLTQAPGWLSINPNSGLISGTAPQVNSNTYYNIIVEVSDGNGGTDTQSYTLLVKNHATGETSGGGMGFISENNVNPQNKYSNQINPDNTITYVSNTTKTSAFPISTLIYFLILGIILLAIIIALLLVFSQRRYTAQPAQKSQFNETYY